MSHESGRSPIIIDFEIPRPPRDDFAAELFRHYELPPNPSLREIVPVALPLLAIGKGEALEAAELVLGRYVSEDELVFEDPALGILLQKPGSAEEKMGMLIRKATAEQAKAE